jgi:predicted DNA-binding transcriptional regulator AlpA
MALERYVGYAELAKELGLSRRTIERMVQRGTWPKPHQLSPARVGWPLSEVKGALAERGRALANSAVADPADLAPEEALSRGLSLALDAAEKLTGQRPEATLFVRSMTEAERGKLSALDEWANQRLRDLYSELSKEEALLAAWALFTSLNVGLRHVVERVTPSPLPEAGDWEGRNLFYLEMIGRALQRLEERDKKLPGLPSGKRLANSSKA